MLRKRVYALSILKVKFETQSIDTAIESLIRVRNILLQKRRKMQTNTSGCDGTYFIRIHPLVKPSKTNLKSVPGFLNVSIFT